MSGYRNAPEPQPRVPLPGRAALALYPPAWRARYRQEALDLLGDLGGGVAAAASLAWRAVPAWLWPPRHLHDQAGRMRASLATVLVAWSVLAGLGLVFDQLTQQQPVLPPGYAVIGWSYAIFDVAFAVSGLILAAGALPLWLLMLRRARRQHSGRDTVYLLMPALAPAGFLACLVILVRFDRHPHGAGPWWFAALTLAGFAAAAAAAAGPALALRRLRPRGPAVRLAAIASAMAVATMLLAGVASLIAGAGHRQRRPWRPGRPRQAARPVTRRPGTRAARSGHVPQPFLPPAGICLALVLSHPRWCLYSPPDRAIAIQPQQRFTRH